MCRPRGRPGAAPVSLATAGSSPGNLLAFFCIASLASTVCPAGRLSERQANQRFSDCFNFSRGNEFLREFYSPGWPAMYPKGVTCERTISAPEGYHIEIDFRGTFDVEESPHCENDYLLIRDGKESYSHVLARLCGHHFPDTIRSTRNHLWLQFKSDATIEYKGFHAVYTFHEDESYIKAPECKFEVSGPEVIISTGNITEQYRDFIDQAIDKGMSLDCSWRVIVPNDKEIQISFKTFRLNKPNECEQNFVQILYGSELYLNSTKRFCSSKADSVKLPKGQDVTFRYFATPPTLPGLLDEDDPTTVVAVATELRERKEDCREDEFDCDDLYCISAKLVCNGNFNCDKQLDEKNCDLGKDSDAPELLTSANVTIMVIGAALLFGLCFSVCWNCVRKLREDLREKEEIVRQSREADLDTLPETMPRVRSRVTLDDGGCYVPGVELKLLPERRNGSTRLVREDLIDLDVDTTDCGCQTAAASRRRDSRDSCASGSSTPPPPPPPCRPPSSVYRGRHHEPHMGYDTAPRPRPRVRPRDDEEDEDEDRSGMATPRSYRSEAVIEMVPRPASRHSARSAPDVVVKL
ncbi:neuropilin and tolloid-like protein 2 [Amphibalanus amphitrite]|uniref:neuropilin and tolloid-like protein 2 n=1 Tax=Amphibalanus amphitrite TaxID=1232801 RepID=UPI001C9124D6|nr:neuropilin and tolloid-like protein 2 [Amphibalanus amphitrite]